MAQNKTFAERAKLIEKKYPYHKHSKRDHEAMMDELEALAMEQEAFKQQNGIPGPTEKMSYGGKALYDDGGPTDPIKLVDLGTKSAWGGSNKLTPEIARRVKIARDYLKKEHNIDIPLGDTFVPTSVKKAAHARYLKNMTDFNENGYYTNDKGQKVYKAPPKQAGEDSFHIKGDALDLDQNIPKEHREKIFQALRGAGLSQFLPTDSNPGEWWHWSVGEFDHGPDYFGDESLGQIGMAVRDLITPPEQPQPVNTIPGAPNYVEVPSMYERPVEQPGLIDIASGAIDIGRDIVGDYFDSIRKYPVENLGTLNQDIPNYFDSYGRIASARPTSIEDVNYESMIPEIQAGINPIQARMSLGDFYGTEEDPTKYSQTTETIEGTETATNNSNENSTRTTKDNTPVVTNPTRTDLTIDGPAGYTFNPDDGFQKDAFIDKSMPLEVIPEDFSEDDMFTDNYADILSTPDLYSDNIDVDAPLDITRGDRFRTTLRSIGDRLKKIETTDYLNMAAGVVPAIANLSAASNVSDPKRITPNKYTPSLNATYFDSTPIENRVERTMATAAYALGERGGTYDDYIAGLRQVNQGSAEALGTAMVEGQKLNMAEQARIDQAMSQARQINTAAENQADIDFAQRQDYADQLRRDYRIGAADAFGGIFKDMADARVAKEAEKYYRQKQDLT